MCLYYVQVAVKKVVFSSHPPNSRLVPSAIHSPATQAQRTGSGGGGQRLQEAAYSGDKSSRRLFYLDLEAVGVCSILRQRLQGAVYSGNMYIEVRTVSD